MRRFRQLLLIIVCLLCYTNFGKTENVNRIRRQFLLKRDCSDIKNSWECDDLQMIKCGTVCDGKADCRDKSDETAFACRSYYCADDRFRCAYGGCISAEKECDGHQDCADNSDELTLKCPGVVGNWTKAGSCLEGFFQCQPNECIFEELLCNGAKDCIGGEDETPEQCSNHYCPEPNFRCDYGGCILSEFKCDSKEDCADGFDESEILCGIKRVPLRETIPYSGTEDNKPNGVFKNIIEGDKDIVLTNDKIPKTVLNNNDEYTNLMMNLQIELLESHLEILKRMYKKEAVETVTIEPLTPNTVLPLVKDPPPTGSSFGVGDQSRHDFTIQATPPTSGKNNAKDCVLTPTPNLQYHVIGQPAVDKVGNGYRVHFSCMGQNGLVGINTTFCYNGNFIDDPPKCQAFCSTISLNTLSVLPTCHTMEGQTIPCTSLVPPKTVAILECKVGYKRPERVVKDAITCQEDGSWDYRVFKCEQICGTISDGRGYVIGGAETEIAKIPWHAAIYQNQNGNFEQICGGSIINPTAIITAAHCFWDGRLQKINSPELYRAAVGKTLRDFKAPESSVQRFKITTIDVYDQYNDINGLFVGDIAVVVLESPIIFHAHIKPICIDHNLQNSERYVKSGMTGRVAGWGLTSSGGEPSPVLKVIDLPTVDFSTCYRTSPPEFKQLITADKFCAGLTTGQSVCLGDSGGGLVFERKINDNSTAFYLRGIVSTSPQINGSCDNYKYSAFTDVLLNIMFLYKYIITS